MLTIIELGPYDQPYAMPAQVSQVCWEGKYVNDPVSRPHHTRHKSNALERSAKCASNQLTERGLSRTWWSNKARHMLKLSRGWWVVMFVLEVSRVMGEEEASGKEKSERSLGIYAVPLRSCPKKHVLT